ncbi:YhgE/Pip domain-containing protein [Bacillus sp. REN10]|uniref:YhgE/Pip domain-containing protein n=1 Tax=Bacillus sp. REN10 TaxID=2782541 RepID=UPI00193BAF35|nr:YhgE/Pip domain-containing protein [Bacillus sp. REN10]
MKKILHIYKTDWLRLFKVPTGILLVIAIMFLPSVYAWVNIEAMWDPYADTSGIKVAVTSEDQGANVRGEKINIGDEVVNNLKKNDKLGWTFVTRKEAERGVKYGDYYASLYIPKDFSKKITSVLKETPQKAAIDYTVNEKLNAVAPKITGKGASSVVAQISENFTKEVDKAVLSGFNQAGIELEKELPTIRNIENKIFQLEERLPAIREMGDKILVLETKLPELREKGQKIIELEKKIPEVEQAGDTIIKLEQKLPQIQQIGEEILLIQSKLPDIQKAGERVVELDQNFYKVEEALDKGIQDAQKASEIIMDAQKALPKVKEIADKGSAFADQLNEFMQQNDGAFDTIVPVVRQNLVLLQQTANSVTQLMEQIQSADFDPAQTLESAEFIKNRLQSGIKMIDHLIDLLTRLDQYVNGNVFVDMVQRLTAIKQNFEQQINQISRIQEAIRKGEQPAKDIVENVRQFSVSASDSLTELLPVFDSEIVPALNQALATLKEEALQSSELLQAGKNRLPDVEAILKDAQTGVQFGLDQLITIQKDLPSVQKKIHEAAVNIQHKMGQVTTAVNAAARFVQQDLPEVEKKVHQAADFVRNDLPAAEKEVHKVSHLIQTKFPEVEKAVHQVANLIRTDLPELEKSVKNAADQIRGFESESDLKEIIELLKNDVQKESDFLADPITLKENKLFHIPNYGSAMSPFYTTLSLWVGAMLLISLFKTDVADPEKEYKSYHIYFGRLLTFLTIGFFQAVIVSLGDIILLNAYVIEKFWFVVFAVLISAVFVTVTYTLVSVFGNIGKGIAIIFLVLQFSSSGGTFPVSLTPSFFQKISPYAPFTYAVSLLREAVAGMIPEFVIKYVLILLLFIAICFVFALLFKKPLSKYTEKMAKKAKETQIIA